MDLSRRTLLQAGASATTAAMIAGGAALVGRAAQARPAQALRPPGAIDEARFLGALEGVTDPEQKRKIIGGKFVEIFEEEADRKSVV